MPKRQWKFNRDLLKSPQYIIFLLITLMIVWMIGSGIVSTIQSRMITKTIIESETQDVSWETYGFLKAEETIIHSDVSGNVDLHVEQSQRAAKNQSVFQVNYEVVDENRNKHTENRFFYAPISGIVSYHIDGYEDMESMREIASMDLKRMYEDTRGKRKSEPKRKVEAGTAYAEVIDNLQPSYVYFRYYPEHNSIFSDEGDNFRVRFPDFDESTTATVEEIVSIENNESFCRVRLGPMSDDFLQERVVKVEPYRVESAKLVLNKSALVYRDGNPGVYVVVNRTVNWRQVTIEEETDNEVICEILPRGTVIITSPQRVELGDIVN